MADPEPPPPPPPPPTFPCTSSAQGIKGAPEQHPPLALPDPHAPGDTRCSQGPHRQRGAVRPPWILHRPLYHPSFPSVPRVSRLFCGLPAVVAKGPGLPGRSRAPDTAAALFCTPFRRERDAINESKAAAGLEDTPVAPVTPPDGKRPGSPPKRPGSPPKKGASKKGAALEDEPEAPPEPAEITALRHLTMAAELAARQGHWHQLQVC